MAKDGQLARIARQPASAEPSLADLLDPIALEERLRSARARRAEALARRPEADRPPAPAAATPQAPVFLTPLPAPEPSAPRRSSLALPVLIFLAGLGLGGALVAVLALRALPERIAVAPTTAPPEPPAAPAPASVVASATAPAVDPEIATPAAPAAPGAVPATPPPAEDVALLDPVGLAEPASEASPSDTASLVAAALPPAAPPAAAEPPAAAAPLPAQVFIHYPASASGDAADARDTLLAAGVGRVEIVPVRYAIGRSNIRFYHDGDRAPAEAMAPVVGTAIEGGTPEARDFTDYATPPAPGKVEIWLAGEPGATARAVRTDAAPAQARPTRTAPSTPTRGFQIPGVIAPPPSQAEQVERILIDRLRRAR